LYQIVTSDEKWIYDNPKRKKSWIDSGQLVNIDFKT